MTRWWVYMVWCVDDSLYTGATNDVPKRLLAHNAGKGARYTRARLPVRLAWSKRVKDKSSALSLEASLKRLSRAQKLSWVRTKPKTR